MVLTCQLTSELDIHKERQSRQYPNAHRPKNEVYKNHDVAKEEDVGLSIERTINGKHRFVLTDEPDIVSKYNTANSDSDDTISWDSAPGNSPTLYGGSTNVDTPHSYASLCDDQRESNGIGYDSDESDWSRVEAAPEEYRLARAFSNIRRQDAELRMRYVSSAAKDNGPKRPGFSVATTKADQDTNPWLSMVAKGQVVDVIPNGVTENDMVDGLRVAAEYNHMSTIELLLRQGVDPLRENGIAIRVAISNGNKDITLRMISTINTVDSIRQGQLTSALTCALEDAHLLGDEKLNRVLSLHVFSVHVCAQFAARVKARKRETTDQILFDYISSILPTNN